MKKIFEYILLTLAIQAPSIMAMSLSDDEENYSMSISDSEDFTNQKQTIGTEVLNFELHKMLGEYPLPADHETKITLKLSQNEWKEFKSYITKDTKIHETKFKDNSNIYEITTNLNGYTDLNTYLVSKEHGIKIKLQYPECQEFRQYIQEKFGKDAIYTYAFDLSARPYPTNKYNVVFPYYLVRQDVYFTDLGFNYLLSWLSTDKYHEIKQDSLLPTFIKQLEQTQESQILELQAQDLNSNSTIIELINQEQSESTPPDTIRNPLNDYIRYVLSCRTYTSTPGIKLIDKKIKNKSPIVTLELNKAATQIYKFYVSTISHQRILALTSSEYQRFLKYIQETKEVHGAFPFRESDIIIIPLSYPESDDAPQYFSADGYASNANYQFSKKIVEENGQLLHSIPVNNPLSKLNQNNSPIKLEYIRANHVENTNQDFELQKQNMVNKNNQTLLDIYKPYLSTLSSTEQQICKDEILSLANKMVPYTPPKIANDDYEYITKVFVQKFANNHFELNEKIEKELENLVKVHGNTFLSELKKIVNRITFNNRNIKQIANDQYPENVMNNILNEINECNANIFACGGLNSDNKEMSLEILENILEGLRK